MIPPFLKPRKADAPARQRRAAVWFINHYAEPVDGMATRPIDIANRLSCLGYDITIFASNFDNYALRDRRSLGARLWRSERSGRVTFVWIRTPPYGPSSGLDRMVNMAVFALLVTAIAAVRSPRPDIVVGVTTHPLAAFAGWVIAKAKRARYFFEVTDLWPETLIQFGRLRRGGAQARLLRALEHFLYEHAERIIMLWRDTHSYVAQVGADPTKIVWIPHGVELDRYQDVEPYEGTVKGRHFRLVFLGGFNLANSIGTIVDAGEVLLSRGRHDIDVELIGAGRLKSDWIRLVKERGLTNISFPPPVPKTDLARALSRADGFVYGLQDIGLYEFGITLNKLFDYLAAKRPIVFFGRTSYDPVAIADAGYVVPPGNPTALADTIEKLVGDTPASRVAMGERGYAFLVQNHLIRDLALKYDALFRTPAPRAQR